MQFVSTNLPGIAATRREPSSFAIGSDDDALWQRSGQQTGTEKALRDEIRLLILPIGKARRPGGIRPIIAMVTGLAMIASTGFCKPALSDGVE